MKFIERIKRISENCCRIFCFNQSNEPTQTAANVLDERKRAKSIIVNYFLLTCDIHKSHNGKASAFQLEKFDFGAVAIGHCGRKSISAENYGFEFRDFYFHTNYIDGN